MHRLADVNAVVDQVIQIQLVDGFALAGRDPLPRQFAHEFRRRSDRREPLEEHPDRRCFLFVNDEFSVPHLVAERHRPTHPHASFSGGGELVPNAFADHFAFELRKEQDVQCQPPHACRVEAG